MSSVKSAIVVGLGGVTNGGKTTICNNIKNVFSSSTYNINVKSLHLDDYFRSSDDPNLKYLEKFNLHDWDCLDALEIERFISDFQSMRLKYDLLLVEGFLIYNIFHSHDSGIYDLAYYFDLPYDECRRRRSQRKYEQPDSSGYFDEHVWPKSVRAKNDAFQLNKNKNLKVIDTSKQSFGDVQKSIINDIEIELNIFMGNVLKK